MPMKKPEAKLLTGQFSLIMLITFSMFLVHYILLISIPLFIKDMGGSNSEAGLSTGLYSLSALVFRPLIGYLLDTKGRKKILFTGLFLMITGIILTNIFDSISMFLAARILQGIGFSITSTASATMTSDIVPKSRLSEGMGYYGVVIIITNSIGPLLGFLIIDLLGYELLFLLLLPVALFSTLASIFLTKDNTGSSFKRKRFNLRNLITIEKSALPASSMMIFASLSYGAIITFLVSFGYSRGIENMQFFFIIYPAAVILTRFISGRISDRANPLVVIIPAVILAVISLIIIYNAYTVRAFAIASFLYGLGYGTLQPVLNALSVKNCSKEKRGAANATFYIAFDLGIGAGSIILGYLSKMINFSSIYLISAVSVGLSLFLFLLVNRKTADQPVK